MSAKDVDLLSYNKFFDRQASELKGAYVGKAQENVSAAMKEAQGGVLFIDEAYELANGQYGKEALTTLVGLMTKPEYSKTVVILAGYKEDIHDMLAQNQGAMSRFSEPWHFEDWTADDCVAFIAKRAEKEGALHRTAPRTPPTNSAERFLAWLSWRS